MDFKLLCSDQLSRSHYHLITLSVASTWNGQSSRASSCFLVGVPGNDLAEPLSAARKDHKHPTYSWTSTTADTGAYKVLINSHW